MKRFNLLHEVKSVKNLLRPDESERPDASRSRSRAPYYLAALLAGALGVAYAFSGALFARERGAASRVDPVASRESSVGRLGEENRADGGDDGALNILSARPMVKTDAVGNEPRRLIAASRTARLSSPLPGDARTSESPKSEASRARWALRYGVCRYRASCDLLVARLREVGIGAVLTRARATVTTSLIEIGPFEDEAAAKLAVDRLRREAIKTDIMIESSDDGRWIARIEEGNAVDRKLITAAARGHGYDFTTRRSKERQDVYKVYSRARWDERSSAELEERSMKERKIDCAIEQL